MAFFGKEIWILEVQEGFFANVGVELAQGKDFSATAAPGDFTENLKLLPASPEWWAGLKNPLSTDDGKWRRCKLGELCWVAAVSRPDLCARVAIHAPRINARCGCDVVRTNGLVRAAKEWQHATALKSALPCRPWETLGSGGQLSANLSESEQGGSLQPDVFGWMVGCRLWGPIDGRQSPIWSCNWLDALVLFGPTPYFLRACTFIRKRVKSRLGGEVYALSEMAGHMLLKDCHGPSEGMNPGMAWLGDCESLSTRLKTKRMIAGK